MNDLDIDRLINELLRAGDIKFYADGRCLASLASDIRASRKDDDGPGHILAIERYYRDNADDILEKLELSHLRPMPR